MRGGDYGKKTGPLEDAPVRMLVWVDEPEGFPVELEGFEKKTGQADEDECMAAASRKVWSRMWGRLVRSSSVL